MAEQEEDFSSLPLPDRFTHKNWKVRKEGYEDAAKTFSETPDESHPAFKPFILDSGLWRGAVLDSNVAAQQEGVNALCAFLKFGGAQAASRSRSATVTPIVEKGLSSTKAATKQSSVEALLLYVEVEGKADALLEDLLQGLSNKQPKIVAATLGALTTLYHAYGVKIIEPKPPLKALPKVFGHADKNVRAEASNLAVELYRWLREAMKTTFWNDLKPVQQQDLEKLFEGVKSEPTPKQDRLLRSQQAAKEAAPAGDEAVEVDEEEVGEVPEVEAFDLAEPVDVIKKMPSDFHEKLSSAKWKDRKETLDEFYEVANTERIQDGHYDEVIQGLAKSMKDANVAVVTVAANCITVLAKGLRKSFAKYRSRILAPILERLKEKKQSVAEALGQALDAVFLSTGLSECLEDILEFLKHKNPQVKSETLGFLIRCLKTTRDAPSKPEVKSIADAATKLLTESTEATRAAGAEALGTLMKIMGERQMQQYLEGLDDIRKTKIKEYCDAAVVKAKDKPKPVAPPPKAAPPPQKRMVKKTAPGLKPPVKRPSTPQAEKPAAPSPQPKPAAGKSIPSKLGSLPKPGLTAPSAGLKKKLAGAGPAPTLQSPRRDISSPGPYEEAPAPKLGRGLAGRPLGKPSSASSEPPPPSAPPGMTPAQRAEFEDLRAEKEHLQRVTEDLRAEKAKFMSQIHELQHQNAQLIEDHTRDVLSIKAKETQLVRARSDAEAAESMVQRQGREMERLKRELSRSVRDHSPPSDDQIYQDRNSNPPPHHPNMESYDSSRSDSREVGYQRARVYMGSPSEEKENGGLNGGVGKKEAEPPVIIRELGGGALAEGREETAPDGQTVDSWKRAGEVTSRLKARIEMMKAKQGLTRPGG
ncbi:MAG: Cytoskeleton associated protein 5 [Alectoria sarmentosa]|nr:MAG: Cytoskeleton associated protein 5 [Alectoria sarmentosa]CAD6590874.1 MAG: Cytoskeleton associated protein 5 [Alectoria sarmentosa]